MKKRKKKVWSYVESFVDDATGVEGILITGAVKRGKYYVIPYEAGLVTLPKGGIVKIETTSFSTYTEKADKIDRYRWRSKHDAKYTFSKDKSIPWILEVEE